MLDFLKQIEIMDIEDIRELKEAILAYDVGLTTHSITLAEAEAVVNAIGFYYGNDEMTYYENEGIVDSYYDYLNADTDKAQ